MFLVWTLAVTRWKQGNHESLRLLTDGFSKSITFMCVLQHAMLRGHYIYIYIYRPVRIPEMC